jgi:subtilisin family serine protease
MPFVFVLIALLLSACGTNAPAPSPDEAAPIVTAPEPLTTAQRSTSFRLENSRNTPLNYTIALEHDRQNPQQGDWVLVDPDAGTIPARGQTTITLTLKPNLPAGRYRSRLIVSYSGGQTAVEVTANLTTAPEAGGFTLTTDDVNSSVIPGAPLEIPIFINRTSGFSAAVSLSLFGAPEGISATFTPNPVSGSEATLQLQTDGSVPSDTYQLAVRGDGGGVTHSLEVALLVVGEAQQPDDFRLALDRPSITLAPGGSSELTLEVRPSGNFDDPVTLSAPGAPAGLSVSFADNPARRATSVTVRASSQLAAGTYEVTLQGQSGARTRQVSVSVTVAPRQQADARLRVQLTTDNAAIALTPQPRSEALHGAALTLPTSGPAYVPGQILVQYRSDAIVSLQREGHASLEALSALEASVASDHQLRRVGELDPRLTRYQTMTDDITATLQALRNDPRVAIAEPNYYIDTQRLPNDPRLAEQWPLAVSGLPVSWGVATRSDKVIAVVDTGIQTNHQDLQGVFINQGRDFCASDNCQSEDSSVLPEHAADTHGTHVTGIIAARGDNGRGVAGVLYGGARIVPIKAFYYRANEGRAIATVESVTKAIRYAIGERVGGNINPHPANILNLSLGFTQDSQLVRQAIETALANNVLVVAAAGNGGQGTLSYPARYEGVLAVGSVNSQFQRSCFSNYGPGLDLMAAGGDGFAATAACRERANEAVLSTHPNNQYGYEPGTSMAAPLVSGVAALFWGANPNLSAAQVAARLRQATYRDSWMSSSEYGAGVLRSEALFGLPMPGESASITLSGPTRAVRTARLRLNGAFEPLTFDGLPAGSYQLEAIINGPQRSLRGIESVPLREGETREQLLRLRQ